MICPDVPEGESLYVHGSAASMISSLFSFKIERCNVSDPATDCVKPDKIEEFINDVQIDAWQISQQMDFLKLSHPPTFKLMTPVYSNFLRHDSILGLQFYLMNNYFKLKDTYL